ncbi:MULTISPECIES: ABC transporter ATP-binding protein [Kitasatospora]|uniref:Putative peptide ABC transporter ATP-binding protein n=1 Tax=Kitasatospora setae (strain ATCC 33774 / DSM 43861 / JCM 3304 / KCC A-0304 / NBRC 14216 / KM-6054) TaxID=452652 RepID=E4N900_KITSK|nr:MULTISPECIES: ABC transporter ATP-binding protein [Kitasatospora]BAJ27681.1 putative peptide ABC transporter ATP-binding protein [Kitasatospora setae KM-6054]
MTVTTGDRAVVGTVGGPLLEVRGLRVEAAGAEVVHGVDLTVRPGEILGLVGESGSGKTLTALAVNRMLPPRCRTTAGTVRFGGTDLLALDEPGMRAVRGRRIGMVFQDPLAYLNPRTPVGRQLAEAALVHGAGRAAAKARALELLDQVGIAEATRRYRDRPHEFSGGMRQRVLIAMAMANRPELLIADEPTTALDPTTRVGILDLLVRLRDETGTAVLLITHDLGTVARSCDTVQVTYAGRTAERAPAASLLARPRHRYTAGLLAGVPRLDTPPGHPLTVIPGRPPAAGEQPPGCAFAARCPAATERCADGQPGWTGDPADGFACHHPADGLPAQAPSTPFLRKAVAPEAAEAVLVADDLTVRYGRRRPPALEGVSLRAAPGRAVGVIGESGSGKSTLARALLGLLRPQSGTVRVGGRGWDEVGRAEERALRRRVQFVFQDPYASLSPRMTVREALAEPPAAHGLADAPGPERLCELVGLPETVLDARPHRLSGGQRQRVAIARALSVGPEVLVADEPTSALDVSVQAQILNLFGELRERTGVGLVFVSHDLALVRHLCDEVLVLRGGRVVEHGPAAELFAAPAHPYTRELLAAAAVPSLDPA